MIGALIGDTIGSVYEFNNVRRKDFELFSKHSFLTDDSIMTLAVAEIFQMNYINDKDKIIDTFKKWGRAYPDRGYGNRFCNWLFTDTRESYRSYGNGAAMRISPVGWYANSEEEVIDYAIKVTEVTHSHPEGIKGAIVTAMCVYYARIGKSKEFIKEYVERHYNIDLDYEYLRKNYWFNETCQDTVPQAIYCFLISTDFEDCVRTTISIGGDCDTTAAISCAIAEAYYKQIPQEIVQVFNKYIPTNNAKCYPRKVIDSFVTYQSKFFDYLNDVFKTIKEIREIRVNTDYIFSSAPTSYEAYRDRLIISKSRISYKHIPYPENKITKKWDCENKTKEYLENYEKLCDCIRRDSLSRNFSSERTMITDCEKFVVKIIYTDMSSYELEYYADYHYDRLYEITQLIKKLIPNGEIYADFIDSEELICMDRDLLYESIDILSKNPTIKWSTPKAEGDVLTFSYPIYESWVWRIFDLLPSNYEYSETVNKIQESTKKIDELSFAEIKAMLTYVKRGEKFCDGHIAHMIEDGTLLKILKRLAFIYNRNEK